MIIALLFLANVVTTNPLCEEVRVVMMEFGATQKEQDDTIRRCNAINNPELEDQNDA